MRVIPISGLILSACLFASQASAQVLQAAAGKLTSYDVHEGALPDFANAKPLPLPMSRNAPPSQRDGILNAPNLRHLFGAAKSLQGATGSGESNPVRLFAPRENRNAAAPDADIVPNQFGTQNHPFTTSLVNASGNNTVNFYPYRAAGKLFFKIGTGSFVCSASMVQRGLAVTAAHCVANYGAKQFYSAWQFVPAYQNGSAPFGTWTVAKAWILTAYYAGTDNCFQAGVICPDDVAILVLKPNGVKKYAGDYTGYFGVGWNGYSFNGSAQALISQLGYPVALNGGSVMERNDSQGFTNAGMSNNTIIGSLMTGGSSGGPWLVNLGMTPSYGCDSGGCTVKGTGSQHNTVVGVTSWGYLATAGFYRSMQQGAAPFTSGNVCALINSACFNPRTGRKAACNITSPLAC